MKQITHNVYIDDSGTKEYESDGKYTDGSTRYFAFGGVVVTPASELFIDAVMNGLKTATFGTAQVEIKANWLRHGGERKKRYTVKYGITDQDVFRFSALLYELVRYADLSLCAAVIDKVGMQRDYSDPDHNPNYPHSTAYEFLLQRVQLEMAKIGGYAHITIDDITGKTPKRSEYKRLIRRHHAKLKRQGSIYLRGFRFDNIAPNPTFADSRLVNMIQIADLCAYGAFRQYTEYGRFDAASRKAGDVYKYLQKMLGRFWQGPGGKIEGYGIVSWPPEK